MASDEVGHGDGATIAAPHAVADGQQVYADADGRLLLVDRKQIEERGPLLISLIPEGLTDLLTDGELRDLIPFLLTCR